MARPRVPYRSFSSVTVAREIAERGVPLGATTAFPHVGDHDLSGESIFVSIAQDVGVFVAGTTGGEPCQKTGRFGGHFLLECVALTSVQVEEYGLISSKRSRATRSSNTSTGSSSSAP